MSNVVYGSIEGSCPQESSEVCFGCSAQDLVDRISSQPDSETSAQWADFFNKAFKAAREAVASNPSASHKKIDEHMGGYSPKVQDSEKKLGDLDKSQLATMAKNCAIARSKGRCLLDVVAAREKRLLEAAKR